MCLFMYRFYVQSKIQSIEHDYFENKLSLNTNLYITLKGVAVLWENTVWKMQRYCITVEALFSSVQLLSRARLFVTPWITADQASLSITNSRGLPKLMSISWWYHPAISTSVVPFSSCPQSLPASGSFPMSQLFTWSCQSIGVSASASVLPMNTQDWSPLGWTGCISLQSNRLSTVFSNTTVQKHQFFSTQLS